MTKATNADGSLQNLSRAKLITPYSGVYSTIYLRILPDITDSKNANYQGEAVTGRSTTITNYSHSEPRTISVDFKFISLTCEDITTNMNYLKTLQSLVYPGPSNGSNPFSPPVVCKLLCGSWLEENGVCVIMKSYSFKPDTTIPFHCNSYLPYYFVVSCQFEAVYSCNNIPSNNMIRTVTKNWTCPCLPNDG